MKFAILFVMVMAAAASAFNIDVDISENLKGSVIHPNVTASNGIANFTTEFYNSGTSSFRARARLDSGKSTVWSDEHVLYPGDRQLFNLYIPLEGSVRYRIYFGNEIISSNWTNITSTRNSRVLNSSVLRTTEKYIDVAADADEFYVSSIGAPAGWIVEGVSAKNTTIARVNYQTPVWAAETIRLAVFTPDGSEYTELDVKLQAEKKAFDVSRLVAALISPMTLLLHA